MWTEAKVSDSLTSTSWASEDQGVLTLWSTSGELVQSDGLTTSIHNLGTGASGESESGNSGLWELKDTVVIGDGTNNDNGLVSGTLLLKSTVNSGHRHWWSVDLGKEQRLEHNLVEWSLSTTC